MDPEQTMAAVLRSIQACYDLLNATVNCAATLNLCLTAIFASISVGSLGLYLYVIEGFKNYLRHSEGIASIIKLRLIINNFYDWLTSGSPVDVLSFYLWVS